MRDDLTLVIAVQSIPFLRPREQRVLVERLDGVSSLRRLTRDDLERIIGRRVRSGRYCPAEAIAQAEEAEKHLTGGRIDYTLYWDSTYPPQLREIYDPPVMLYFRGELPDYHTPMVGVVGTRYPSGLARKAAFRLGLELGRVGVTVVSGLARGIDCDAHLGNTAGGGKTVAVLGNGIDFVYPASSTDVARDILRSGGCLLSEFPPATPPLKYNFPFRNRIVSGLSRSVVVVEAPTRSGALITADYALEQGRDLYVHLDGLAGSSGEGGRGLLDAGAPPISCAGDIFDDWQWWPRAKGAAAGSPYRDAGVELERELSGTRVRYNGVLY